MLHLPATVYTYNSKRLRYELSGCWVYSARVRPLPTVLNCSTGMSVLSDNIELLKQTMCAPAIVLVHGTQITAYSASGDKLDSVPVMARDDKRIIKTYEMMCMNLTSKLVTYRLRGDGVLILRDCGEVNCVTCYIPPNITMANLKRNLSIRADALRKTLRDRRLTVVVGPERLCVFSLETLLPKGKAYPSQPASI